MFTRSWFKSFYVHCLVFSLPLLLAVFLPYRYRLNSEERDNKVTIIDSSALLGNKKIQDKLKKYSNAKFSVSKGSEKLKISEQTLASVSRPKLEHKNAIVPNAKSKPQPVKKTDISDSKIPLEKVDKPIKKEEIKEEIKKEPPRNKSDKKILNKTPEAKTSAALPGQDISRAAEGVTVSGQGAKKAVNDQEDQGEKAVSLLDLVADEALTSEEQAVVALQNSSSSSVSGEVKDIPSGEFEMFSEDSFTINQDFNSIVGSEPVEHSEASVSPVVLFKVRVERNWSNEVSAGFSDKDVMVSVTANFSADGKLISVSDFAINYGSNALADSEFDLLKSKVTKSIEKSSPLVFTESVDYSEWSSVTVKFYTKKK